MSNQTILGKNGTIARRLANYEARPQQLTMAQAVAAAIRNREHLMVEAGTGVGKSFAYLVPAIEAALASPHPSPEGKEGNFRVVVSTHTISLQEQLIHKDLPFLQSVMPEPFTAVLVKGRSNYLSRRRLRVAQQKAGSLLFENSLTDQLNQIGAWTRRTQDGSKSDLEFRPSPIVWDLVESDSGNCLGRKCADYEKCFFFKARRQLHDAQLMVVNHALFFSDLALRRNGVERGLLPKYQVAILDEAHTLEDVAAEHLGLQMTRGQVDFLLNKLLHEKGGAGHGLLGIHGHDPSWQQVYRTRQASEKFFTSILDWRAAHSPQGKPGDTQRIRQANFVPNVLSSELDKLATFVDQAMETIDGEEEKIELEAAANRCRELAGDLKVWLEQKLAGQVYWIEGAPHPALSPGGRGDKGRTLSPGGRGQGEGGQRGNRLCLACAPIEVGSILKDTLFDRIPTVVLTSATLSVGGKSGFDHFQKRLGFPDHTKLQLGSPFDFREQAELHLFRKMPDPTSPAYEEACLEKIQKYVTRTRGRAFVLFTSIQSMDRAARKLRDGFAEQGIELLCQSDGQSPNQLLERFRRSSAAVLFGVDSFWQGVDVQGEALSNVIITRLPFVPPDRPIVEARTEAIQKKGGQSFYDYQVPVAIIKLKQGFGRLIRTRTDRGMVVILDPRILTKPYGRWFLDALPECKKFVDGAEMPGYERTMVEEVPDE